MPRFVAMVLLLGGLSLACDHGRPEHKPAPPPVETPALRATDGANDWRVTDKDVLLRLQGRLQDLSLYLGPVDGRYRNELEVALKQFQAARGLPATGKLDLPTADALGLRTSDVRPPATGSLSSRPLDGRPTSSRSTRPDPAYDIASISPTW